MSKSLALQFAMILQDIVQLELEMRQRVGSEIEDGDFEFETHSQQLGRISDAIVWHVAPVGMLAHSRTNLAAKLRIFLHTLGLLCGSRAQLVELCQSVVSIHTDYGTEKGICRVQEVSLDMFLPYMHAPDLSSEVVATEGEAFLDPEPILVDEALAFLEQPPPQVIENTVSFQALEGPDLMHVIHNVTGGLEDILETYGAMMSRLKAICSLLAGRETKQQLLETCFSVGAAMVYQDAIQSFQVVPHDARWNSIAASIEELHVLEPGLRKYWSLRAFLGSEDAPVAKPGDEPGGGELGVNLALVDEGIHSDMFWGSVTVMLQIAVVQRAAVQFVNSCSCHEAWEHSEIPERRSIFQKCPLRGRRCAELTSGAFFQLLQSLLDACPPRLELQLPRGLSKSDMSKLMRDFETARQHIITTYVLKLSFWMHAPHALAGLAHWDPRIRAESLLKCLQSNCDHPKIRQLKQEHMTAAQDFLAGGGVWTDDPSLDPLRKLALEMRLMFTSAWRVEAQHARTKRAAQKAPRHSAAYTSLSHRLPDIKAHLAACPQDVGQLASLMDQVVNGRDAARRLGFQESLLLRSGWVSAVLPHKDMGFRVIYHDDPYCKYTLEMPKSVNQRTVRQVNPSGPPALETDDLQGGSEMLRHALALQDVKKAVKRKMYFTMKFNRATLHELGSLLKPLPPGRSAEDFFSLSWGAETGSMPAIADAERPPALPDFGQTRPLQELLSGAASALADEFVVASVLHEQPSRFPRTHVDGEASLSGMWFIQFHNIVEVDATRRTLTVSLEAARPGNLSCEHTPLTLHVSQLSLAELMQVYVWQVETAKLLHRLDNQCAAGVPQRLRGHVPQALELLFRSFEGLAHTADISPAVASVLEHFVDAGMITPAPWKLTPPGHARVLQCVQLSNESRLLQRSSGPLQEASLFQLVLELDHLGWKHEVVTHAQHKDLRKKKHLHRFEDTDKVWYTRQGALTVSRSYLMALLSLDGEKIKAVPYGAKDQEYLALQGLADDEIEARLGRGRRQKRLQLVDESMWPEPKPKAAPRKRQRKAPVPAVLDTVMEDDVPMEEGGAEAGGVGSLSEAEGERCELEHESDSDSSSSGPSSSDSSTSGSGSSSSSSSSSSTTSSSPAQPAGSRERPTPAEPAGPAVPAPKKKHHKVMDRSVWWGDHLLTPVGPVGEAPKHWQIKCGFPDHNLERACTKKRSVTFGGADARTHQQRWDEVVLPAWRSNTLPPLSDLRSSTENP